MSWILANEIKNKPHLGYETILENSIPENFKESIDVPWKNMAGLRDLVSHDYFGLDLNVIWHTVKDSVPETEKNIKKYLGQ